MGYTRDSEHELRWRSEEVIRLTFYKDLFYFFVNFFHVQENASNVFIHSVNTHYLTQVYDSKLTTVRNAFLF